MPTGTLKKQPYQFRKIERVEARLNPDQKRRIEYAARLKGTSISDFLVSSADEAAARAIEQQRAWELTETDSRAFVNALLRPPAPAKRTKLALAKYKRQVAAS